MRGQVLICMAPHLVICGYFCPFHNVGMFYFGRPFTLFDPKESEGGHAGFGTEMSRKPKTR